MSEKVSKSMRFDVFHRDAFTCQYCGRKPPEVVLNADHIIAVSSGGKSEMDNLITACFECNNGKRAKPLERIPAALALSDEKRAERLEQLAAYHQYLQQQARMKEQFMQHVIIAWAEMSGQKKEDVLTWTVPYGFGEAGRKFLRYLTPEEVIEAIYIAFDRYPYAEPASTPRFKFFCGVCWKKIRSKENPKPQDEE
jgi:HNH endonuclease